MKACELSDAQARAAAHGLGIFRWSSRPELDALLDAWPSPPSPEALEDASARALVDEICEDLRREQARVVRLLAESMKRHGRRHLEIV